MKRSYALRQTAAPLFVAALLALACLAASPAAAQQPLPDEALTLAQTWLVKNCDIGDEQSIADQLTQWRGELEPFFLNAFNQGPDSTLVGEVQQAAARKFDQRQELLRSGDGLGLSQDDLDAAQNVTREQYIARQRQDFVLRFQSQALLGLGLVGSDQAEALLQRIARDETSSLTLSAQKALQTLQNQ